jgi:hypothetical protein
MELDRGMTGGEASVPFVLNYTTNGSGVHVFERVTERQTHGMRVTVERPKNAKPYFLVSLYEILGPKGDPAFGEPGHSSIKLIDLVHEKINSLGL